MSLRPALITKHARILIYFPTLETNGFIMEEETTLKHRTVASKNGMEDKNDTETDNPVTESKDKMDEEEEIEDDKKQIEHWKKYKAMSFMEKYKMEKSARVPSVILTIKQCQVNLTTYSCR